MNLQTLSKHKCSTIELQPKGYISSCFIGYSSPVAMYIIIILTTYFSKTETFLIISTEYFMVIENILVCKVINGKAILSNHIIDIPIIKNKG